MAKFYIDAGVVTDKGAMVKQDGSAETLVGGVRVIYDDSLSKRQLVTTIDRMAQRINETYLGVASSSVAPVFTVDPVINGTPVEGSSASYTPGTVVGTPTPSRTNDWLLDGSVVASGSYTLPAGSAGKTLAVRDNATNVAGSASRTSIGVAVVAAGTDPYADWLTRLAAAGGDASTVEKNAVAAFITTARTGGVPFWDCITRANAFVNNAAGSLVPFKIQSGGSNDTSPAATTVNAGGRTNTSGTGYVNTQTPPPAAAGGLSVYLRDLQSFSPAVANVLVGSRDTGNTQVFRIAANIRADGAAIAGYVSGAWGGASTAQMESNLGAGVGVGHWHVQRNSATSLKLRRNGALVGTEFTTSTTATPVSDNIFVFAQNGGGTAGAFTKTPTSIGYYAIVGTTMSDAQAAAYDTAVVALMTAMGRNL